MIVCGLVLLSISTCNFLFNLDVPNGPFWDENYYLTATARYAESRPQFASHPPLGLMLIAGGDALSGANKNVNLAGLARVKAVSAIGLPPRYQLWGPRAASASFGVAIVITVYAVLLATGLDIFLAAATAGLVAFETADIVQFRGAQLDAFQVEFALVCVGILLIAALRRPSLKRALYFGIAGLAAGAATMVKLDGILLFAMPGTIIGLNVARRWRSPRALRNATFEVVTFFMAVLLVVTATYTVQSLWCDQPLEYGAPAAATDARFMSSTYQHYLDGRLPWSPKVVIAEADDSLRYMLNDQASIGQSDPNGSSPWLQPLGAKSINYRWETQDGLTRYIQLIANPINWTMSSVALLVSAALLLVRPFVGRRGVSRPTATVLSPLVSTALMIYVAHGLLGGHRVMYLYHALLIEVLGLLCAAFLIRELASRRRVWRASIEAGVWFSFAASIVAFIWLSPLAYSRPLTHEACELRNLPFHVVSCRY